jgi:hypothetical protein
MALGVAWSLPTTRVGRGRYLPYVVCECMHKVAVRTRGQHTSACTTRPPARAAPGHISMCESFSQITQSSCVHFAYLTHGHTGHNASQTGHRVREVETNHWGRHSGICWITGQVHKWCRCGYSERTIMVSPVRPRAEFQSQKNSPSSSMQGCSRLAVVRSRIAGERA